MARSKSAQPQKSTTEASYEEMFAQLQEVLTALEAGELNLDDSLDHYERGIQLAERCAQKLNDADLRVQRWRGPNETTPFDDWQADE